MSRKKTQPKKNIVPDPKFKSTIIPKLIMNSLRSEFSSSPYLSLYSGMSTFILMKILSPWALGAIH